MPTEDKRHKPRNTPSREKALDEKMAATEKDMMEEKIASMKQRHAEQAKKFGDQVNGKAVQENTAPSSDAERYFHGLSVSVNNGLQQLRQVLSNMQDSPQKGNAILFLDTATMWMQQALQLEVTMHNQRVQKEQAFASIADAADENDG